MQPGNKMKHQQPLPSVRQIRRTCSRELYRARKKVGRHITAEQIDRADDVYFKKVLANLPYIAENGSNRKLLADWFNEHVCGEVAEIYGVEREVLARAFRDSFGG
ncbi:dehydrogenase [Paenibacillus validus]|uniref:Dehydrogenase n=1 Tax=Paenibacillus validus TaxID=44253 RepID=A0A7X2ZC68_9BACL|nr:MULTISPECIES: dehydrogenase [Paenibacillus]MED4604445.1 dehydrogenase [Paenibacillus validus]MED4609882.1 dehydrogenase [Paenibacillus validus]MUG72154.1 dehydrogenase [Paenibacillus validus]